MSAPQLLLEHVVDGLLIDHAVPCTGKRSTPILFVHGASVGSWFWRNYLAYFSACGYHSYALSLRGHPGSFAVDDIGAVSVDEFAEDVHKAYDFVCAEQGVPPVLAGHSMGGLLAQIVAETKPVAGLVLLASAPPQGVTCRRSPHMRIGMTDALRMFTAIATSSALAPNRKIFDSALQYFGGDTKKLDAFFRKLVPESGLAGWEVYRGSIAVNVGNFHSPTLVLMGEGDEVLDKSVSVGIAERYGTEALIVPGHGHLFPVEDGWEHIANIILHWLLSERIG